MLILDKFGIIENLQMSPSPKTSHDQFLGLDFSYSKIFEKLFGRVIVSCKITVYNMKGFGLTTMAICLIC